MAKTYEELKHRLTDFGFEEDDVADSEYKRIYVNSFNQAGEIIFYTVMLPLEDYIRKIDEIDDEDDLQPITRITEDTANDSKIQIPDVVVPLYMLLAAHYAWLDDDITKATLYYNEFDDLKNQFIGNANRVKGARIEGGF